jgi:hypothetical protein
MKNYYHLWILYDKFIVIIMEFVLFIKYDMAIMVNENIWLKQVKIHWILKESMIVYVNCEINGLYGQEGQTIIEVKKDCLIKS